MALDAVVVADDENLELARQFNFRAVECPNDRMGVKWNAGFMAARTADFSVLIGSDDWLHPDAFGDMATDAITAADSIDFVDLERGVLQHARAAASIPWFIPRALLQPSDFAPMPPHMQRGTEPILLHALGRPPVVHRAGPPAVDFKTAENVGAYAGVRNSIGDGVEHDAWAFLATTYPAPLVELARSLSS